jgi:hypothetical protein
VQHGIPPGLGQLSVPAGDGLAVLDQPVRLLMTGHHGRVRPADQRAEGHPQGDLHDGGRLDDLAERGVPVIGRRAGNHVP